MKQGVSDKDLISFYEAISNYTSVKEIKNFHSKDHKGINPKITSNKALYTFIEKTVLSLKEEGVDALLQHRMNVYHLKPIESIPILKRLEINFEVIEQMASLEKLQKSLLNLIDFSLYSLALNDASHETINIIREYLFTLEDYCLQVEHTIDLREQCQNESASDDLQKKLAEDLESMQAYLNQIEQIYQLLLKQLKKAS